MRLKMAVCASVAMWACCGPAADTSAPIFVFARPDRSSFWHTAPGRTFTLPIDFPAGATSASLTVQGSNYTQTYPEITTASFALTLPETTKLAQEDVYALTLTFDDGTVRTARLGLLRCGDAAAEGVTRCCRSDSAKWGRAHRHGVMPVPAETTSFSVNGTAVVEGDAGFTGAQGWYALPCPEIGSTVMVSLTVGGETNDRSLTVIPDQTGELLFLK